MGAAEPTFKQKVIKWMENHRGIIVVFIVLPLSILFGFFLRARQYFFRRLMPGAKTHTERVTGVQKQIQKWNKIPREKRKPMCTARPNWQSLSTTFFRKDLCHQISLPLYEILSVDTNRMVIHVEPFVTVGEVTAYLVPQGYTLAVCLEVAEATLGGLAMGVGMTTYSHKVGLYQETIVSYEVVLGDGSLVKCTRDNDNRDLYYSLPWSHGTLGFLVGLELQIINVKPHLKLEYIPVSGQTEYCDLIRDLSGAVDKNKKTPDYLEATIYNKNEAVVMVGNFVDVPSNEEDKIINLSAWHFPWFYKYVEGFLKKGKSFDYIPLQDYLLRHNKSIFWVVEDMVPFGNNILFRWLLGWMLPPKIAFLKYTTTPGIRAMTFTKQVFQDIVLPMNQLEDQINISEKLFNVYPILVYPCRIYDHGQHRGQLRPPKKDQMVPGASYAMFNDLGVYGVPQEVKDKKPYPAVDRLRKMEEFTRNVGGYPFLYADTFMSRDEFEKMFDLTLYEDVRKRYDAVGAFPHLHDKIKPEIDVFKVGEQYINPL